jgi:hypothetical protein
LEVFGMSAITRIGCAALLVFALGCSSSETGAMIGEGEPTQAKLPQIKVNLPPPPSFEKDHAPESYPDGSYSVYGLRKNMKDILNKQVRVKGFLIEVYECPECPKGSECPPCRKPHFYVSDRANGAKDKALMVVDYPKEDPETKKKMEFEAGAQYYVNGTYAKTSGTGFSSSDGLMVFMGAKLVSAPE